MLSMTQTLAERVEAASGADRELDADIASLFSHSVESDDGDWWWGPHDAQPVRVPDFTASIDSAATLIPQGDRNGWHVGGHANGGGSAYIMRRPNPIYVVAATPALALCAAALRALSDEVK